MEATLAVGVPLVEELPPWTRAICGKCGHVRVMPRGSAACPRCLEDSESEGGEDHVGLRALPNLGRERKRRRLSRAELAVRAGVSPTTVWRLEAERRPRQSAQARVAGKLAAALGVPVERLAAAGGQRDRERSR